MNPPSQWVMQITDEQGQTRRVPIESCSLVIGRSAEVDIHLDLPTVSRQHAQIQWHDGDNQWHLTDLNSRSGTFVNGEPASDNVAIKPGDVITISHFQLDLQEVSEIGKSTAVISTAEMDEPDISVLTRIVSPKLDTSHITALNDFGRALMEIDRGENRLSALCQLMVGPIIRAKWAMALQLDGDDPTRPLKQLAVFPPEVLERDDLHISRSTLYAMQQSKAPVLASNFKEDQGIVEMSIIAKAPATTVVACPLSDDLACRDLLYVNLPPALGSTEWLALIALAVKQYQQVEASWVAREATRVQAAMERDLDNAREIQRSILPKPIVYDPMDIA